MRPTFSTSLQVELALTATFFGPCAGHSAAAHPGGRSDSFHRRSRRLFADIIGFKESAGEHRYTEQTSDSLWVARGGATGIIDLAQCYHDHGDQRMRTSRPQPNKCCNAYSRGTWRLTCDDPGDQADFSRDSRTDGVDTEGTSDRAVNSPKRRSRISGKHENNRPSLQVLITGEFFGSRRSTAFAGTFGATSGDECSRRVMFSSKSSIRIGLSQSGPEPQRSLHGGHRDFQRPARLSGLLFSKSENALLSAKDFVYLFDRRRLLTNMQGLGKMRTAGG